MTTKFHNFKELIFKNNFKKQNFLKLKKKWFQFQKSIKIANFKNKNLKNFQNSNIFF